MFLFTFCLVLFLLASSYLGLIHLARQGKCHILWFVLKIMLVTQHFSFFCCCCFSPVYLCTQRKRVNFEVIFTQKKFKEKIGRNTNIYILCECVYCVGQTNTLCQTLFLDTPHFLQNRIKNISIFLLSFLGKQLNINL